MRRSFKQQLLQRHNNRLLNNDLQQSIRMEAADMSEQSGIESGQSARHPHYRTDKNKR